MYDLETRWMKLTAVLGNDWNFQEFIEETTA